MARFTSTNPATQDILWEGDSATPAEVNEAVLKAHHALKEWLYTSFEEEIMAVPRHIVQTT